MAQHQATIRTARVITLPLVGLALSALSACAVGHAAPVSVSRAAPPLGRDSSQGSAAPASNAGHAQQPGRPSLSALMICNAETRKNVATLLGMHHMPSTTARWANRVYTCTYRLSQGPLVLSVQEAGSVAAAHNYYSALRARLGTTHTLTGAQGLGLPAYEATGGSTVFLKDDKTLLVDPSQLPVAVGASGRTPSDLAYTIATDIMGCWAGH